MIPIANVYAIFGFILLSIRSRIARNYYGAVYIYDNLIFYHRIFLFGIENYCFNRRNLCLKGSSLCLSLLDDLFSLVVFYQF